jgi:hypothetical protein
MIEVALSMEPMPSEANAKTSAPVEAKVVMPIPCLNACGNKFLPTKYKTKYCSRKCNNHAAQRLYRARNMPVFLPINCKWCGDDFSPRIGHQEFCSSGCRTLWNNIVVRNKTTTFYSQFFNLYIIVGKKMPSTIIEQEVFVRDIHVIKKCGSPHCKQVCKIVRRQYADKPDRIVSWQIGWIYDEKLDEISCKSCQIRFEIISNNNYKHKRISKAAKK